MEFSRRKRSTRCEKEKADRAGVAQPENSDVADPRRQPRTFAVLAVVVWFAAASIAGVLGLVNEPGRPPLVLAGFIALPIAGFVAVYLASRAFRGFLQGISLTLLVGSHLWRFVGIGFVIGWLTGHLPAGFAVPEGFGDIVAAAGALVLIRGLRNGTASRGWLLAWNVFGLIDLVSAIVMGVLYSNSALGALTDGTVTTQALVTFPVNLIPNFFVPLFLLLHALTFKKIAEWNPATTAPTTVNVESRNA
jgi:hypothetical protein